MLKIGTKYGIHSYVSGKSRHRGLFHHLKTTIAWCSIRVVLDAIVYLILKKTKDVLFRFKVTSLFPELVVLIG